MCNDTEERWKIWRGIDLSSLMGCFWPKYIIIELKRNRGVISHDNRVWSKTSRKNDLWFGKSHE